MMDSNIPFICFVTCLVLNYSSDVIHCYKNDTLILKLGMVTGPCENNCNNETIVKSSIPYSDHYISAQLLWRYVDLEEAFLVLQTVNDLVNLDLDAIILAAELTYDLDLPYSYIRSQLPILQWLSYNTTSDPSVILTNQANKCNEMTSQTMEETSLLSTGHESSCASVKPNSWFKTTPPLPALNHSHNLLGNIVSSLVHHVMWSTTFILTDGDHDIRKISELVHSLSSIGITATVHQLPDLNSPTFQDQLLGLIDKAEDAEYNITLLCGMKCVQKVFSKPFNIERKQVQRYPLRHQVKWLVVTSGETPLEKLGVDKTNMDNVDVIVIPREILEKTPFENDNIQSFIWQVVNQVGQTVGNTSFNSTLHLTTAAIELLSSFNQSSALCSWVPIEALMWGKSNRYFQNVGFIKSNGLLLTAGDIFPNQKFGFNRRNFLVATNIWDPFVIKKNNKYSGFCMDILEHLSLHLNFTYDLIEPPDGGWGIQFANGSWSGLVGQMERHEVDLIMAPLSVQPERDQVMDFTYPFYWEPTKIILRKPDPHDKKWRTLIDPFSTTVLICIGISLPLMSFVLFLLERISPYYRSFEDRGSTRGLHHFSDSFWYMYGALLTQGGEHMAESMSGRTLLSFWWIFCIIMMAAYSGNLIAFLTVTKDKLPFETLHEMVNLDNFKWGILGGTSYVGIFQTSEQPDFIQLWDGLVKFNKTDPSVLSTNPDEHIKSVLEGNYAYLGDKTYLELKMVNECNLVLTDEEFLAMHYAIGLPDNSPYTKILSDHLMKIHESGLLQVWKQKHWPKRSFCVGSLVTVASVINLTDLQSAFYLIGIGIVLAVIVLTYEAIIVRFKLKNYLKKTKVSKQTENVEDSRPKVDFF